MTVVKRGTVHGTETIVEVRQRRSKGERAIEFMGAVVQATGAFMLFTAVFIIALALFIINFGSNMRKAAQ